MKDFQVVSSLTQLKALVAGLYGRIDSLAEVAAPAVDFAVDMFDRQDQDTLGPYWSNTEYAIRSGVVVRSSGTSPLISVGSISGVSFTGTTSTSLPAYCMTTSSASKPVIPSSGAVVYAVDFTHSDFTCRVTAVVPPYNNVPPALDAIESYSHYFQVGEHNLYAQVGVGAGVCIANAQNAVFGVGTQTATVPAQYNSYAGYTAATPGVIRSDVAVGSTSPVTTIADDYIVDISDSASAYVWSGKFNAMSTGNNTIVVIGNGDNVTISINGVPFFNGVPPAVAQKSRTRAGIMTGPYSATAALSVATNAAVGGVTSFKAWRNDIPEPPNESGHGTYVNGRWQYTDKYHTPVTDENGNVIRNEDGTVASYIYDPEA